MWPISINVDVLCTHFHHQVCILAKSQSASTFLQQCFPDISISANIQLHLKKNQAKGWKHRSIASEYEVNSFTILTWNKPYKPVYSFVFDPYIPASWSAATQLRTDAIRINFWWEALRIHPAAYQSIQKSVLTPTSSCLFLSETAVGG